MTLLPSYSPRQSQPKGGLAPAGAQDQGAPQSQINLRISPEVLGWEGTSQRNEEQRILTSSLETRRCQLLLDLVRLLEFGGASGADAYRIWNTLPGTAWAGRELGTLLAIKRRFSATDFNRIKWNASGPTRYSSIYGLSLKTTTFYSQNP